MFGMGVGIGIHRHRLYAHALGGGCYATGNFAAVGNEDFFEHDRPAIF
jgi:hypothetical protein